MMDAPIHSKAAPAKRNILAGFFTVFFFVLSWAPLAGLDDPRWAWWLSYFFNFIALVLVVGLLFAIPGVRSGLNRLFTACSILPIKGRHWLLGVFVLVLLLGVLVSTQLFDGIPTNVDSYAYYIQAKIFAHGEWFAPSHPLREFFNTFWFFNDGKYYSKYPPGYPLLLAPMLWLHAQWLLGPLLTASTVVLIYYLTLEIANESAARIATLLAASSSYLILMSGEYLTHTSSLLCCTGFALYYIRAHKHGRWTDAAIAGAFVGALLLIRPQVMVTFTLPFALHWLFTFSRQRQRTFFVCGLIMLAIFCAAFAFFAYYNAQTTGKPWVTGYQKFDGFQRLMVRSVWEGGLPSAQDYVRALSQWQLFHKRLFLWPASSLMFVFLLFYLCLQSRYSLLLVSTCLLAAVSLLFMPWDGGSSLGCTYSARYLFEISGVCIALTALAIVRLPDWLKYSAFRTAELSTLRHAVYSLLIILTVLTVLGMPQVKKECGRYMLSSGMMSSVYRTLASNVKQPALMFIAGGPFIYYPAAIFNPPYEGSPIIAAHNRRDKNKLLMDFYPSYYVYYVENGKITALRPPVTPADAPSHTP